MSHGQSSLGVNDATATATGDDATPRGAFFDVDGRRLIPRPVCRSPWNPGHQNGLVIAGLLMHLAETVEAPVPMLTAHVVIDLLRAVPFKALEGRAEAVRTGRKLQMVESFLLDDGTPVARARALRVREAATPVDPQPMRYPQAETLAKRPFPGLQSQFGELIESRVISGLDGKLGPGVVWARFMTEVVAGTRASPIVRAAMMSDFGNGASNVLDPRRWAIPNVDNSMHLARRPVGEWLMIDASTMSLGQGVGLTDGLLVDREGPFGRVHQTLFVAPVGQEE